MTDVQSGAAIRPEELHRLLSAGTPAELLDVRTPPEFAAAHVSGAKLVPLDDLDVSVYLKQRGASDQPLYVLCQSGGRAKRAIEKFERAGFEGCVLVEGGTQAWMDAGLPVIRGESRVLPLIRQVQIIVGCLCAVGALLALTVNPWWAVVPLVMGCGLLCAGLTGFCGLAVVLTKMPWNRCAQGKSCCSN
jgi:rhodanese-related sulfurtransferase